MSRILHILNGDALHEQLPPELNGEVIVMRECLVVGDVSAENLQDFFKVRSKSLKKLYGTPVDDYLSQTVPEISRFLDVAADTEVNLWFEDDLFCQVNMWFVCSFLSRQKLERVNWVRANNLELGFGGLSQSELLSAYVNKMPLTPKNLHLLSRLWTGFRLKNLEALEYIQIKLPRNLVAVKAAIGAELDRHNSPNPFGKPGEYVREYLAESPGLTFDQVFQSFHRDMSIYGFGDLQVKSMYDYFKSERS